MYGRHLPGGAWASVRRQATRARRPPHPRLQRGPLRALVGAAVAHAAAAALLLPPAGHQASPRTIGRVFTARRGTISEDPGRTGTGSSGGDAAGGTGGDISWWPHFVQSLFRQLQLIETTPSGVPHDMPERLAAATCTSSGAASTGCTRLRSTAGAGAPAEVLGGQRARHGGRAGRPKKQRQRRKGAAGLGVAAAVRSSRAAPSPSWATSSSAAASTSLSSGRAPIFGAHRARQAQLRGTLPQRASQHRARTRGGFFVRGCRCGG